MKPKQGGYGLLKGAEDDVEDIEDVESLKEFEAEKNHPPRLTLPITLSVLLILSISSNIFLTFHGFVIPKRNCEPNHSKFANLIVDRTLPFATYSNYSSSNFTLVDQFWDAVDFDPGIVALPNEWTAAKGLPESARFPWDSTKSIWLLNGYHNLHCVKRIYISLMEYRKNLPQSLPTTHITHCLDSLRNQIICDADDTPRLAHYRKEKGHFTGTEQERQCKDWNALETWAKEHNACYRYGDPTWDERSQYERVMFCPDDSPYLPVVREFFGKGDDWKPLELGDLALS